MNDVIRDPASICQLRENPGPGEVIPNTYNKAELLQCCPTFGVGFYDWPAQELQFMRCIINYKQYFTICRQRRIQYHFAMTAGAK